MKMCNEVKQERKRPADNQPNATACQNVKIKVVLHLVAYFFCKKTEGQPDSDRISSEHDSGDSGLSSRRRNISSGLVNDNKSEWKRLLLRRLRPSTVQFPEPKSG